MKPIVDNQLSQSSNETVFHQLANNESAEPKDVILVSRKRASNKLDNNNQILDQIEKIKIFLVT